MNFLVLTQSSINSSPDRGLSTFTTTSYEYYSDIVDIAKFDSVIRSERFLAAPFEKARRTHSNTQIAKLVRNPWKWFLPWLLDTSLLAIYLNELISSIF